MPPVKEEMKLPEDFDGVFRFTNPTDREFKAMWNKVEYTFPPMKTVPLIIPQATLEETQVIRRKFAKELGVREFYQSDTFKKLDAQAPPGSGNPPALYTDDLLAPFVQKCLDALPEGRVTMAKAANDRNENYSSETKVLDSTAMNAVSLKPQDSAPVID